MPQFSRYEYSSVGLDAHGLKNMKNVYWTLSTRALYEEETAKRVIDETITIVGGYGYFLEQEVERRYRDNRIVEMYEGTVEVQLNNMVRYLKKLNLDFISSTLL
jgi:alkylation response protein AidB-like acyl-CoA dehydrogenase